jgi:hypothetical protein
MAEDLLLLDELVFRDEQCNFSSSFNNKGSRGVVFASASGS